MNSSQEPSEYLDFQQLHPTDLIVEIPASQAYLEIEPIPNGFSPMGEIYVRGRFFRNLASGDAQWWLIIVAWGALGTNIVMAVFLLLVAGELLAVLPLSVAVLISAAPLTRGTVAKLNQHPEESQES